MIDWMVDKDLNTWYQVAGALERRQAQSQQELPASKSPQSTRRQELIENVSQTIKLIVNRYDRKQEADQLGVYVQESVAQTALFGIGALGVGAMVATVLTTKALDVTGIVTAGTLAVLGFFVIPYKRKQAKEEFKPRWQNCEPHSTKLFRIHLPRKPTARSKGCRKTFRLTSIM